MYYYEKIINFVYVYDVRFVRIHTTGRKEQPWLIECPLVQSTCLTQCLSLAWPLHIAYPFLGHQFDSVRLELLYLYHQSRV